MARKPKLKLVGKDGNAFFILGRAKEVLKKTGREKEFNKFYKEATSGDYAHLLNVCHKWFKVS